MFFNIFHKLYHKIFVNIVVHHHKSDIYIEQINNKGIVVDSTTKEFPTSTLTKEMQNFIREATLESPYNYIAILDKSTLQGALPTASKKEYAKYKDLSAYEVIQVDNRWSTYSEKGEIYRIKKEYEALPLDFIFSPFLLLERFFKDKLELSMTLFLLIEKDFISLSVYDHSKLLYAEHLDLEKATDNDEMLIYEDEFAQEDEDDGIDLDDITAIEDLDDMELFDDFGDIEDLDSIDDIDDFSESKDIEEDNLTNIEEESQEIVSNEADGFNEDYQRFLLIQTALNTFYKDDLYESEFIEHVYIADGVGVSHDLKRFLEEEMFLTVYTRKIDLTLALCELAKEEVNL